MAITVKITPTVNAVSASSATEFVTTGPFVLFGDGFPSGCCAYLLRLGPSGSFLKATNKDGNICVSSNPNMIYVDSAGTYRIEKDGTPEAASVGYEVQ